MKIALRLNMVLKSKASAWKSPRKFVICDIQWRTGELALAEQLPRTSRQTGSRYHCKPKPMRIKEIQQCIVTGKYTVCDEPLNPHLLKSKPPTTDMITLRDAHWEMIRPVIEQPAALQLYLYGDGISQQIKELCDIHGYCLKHFYNTLHRSLSLGGTRESCTPDWGVKYGKQPTTMAEPGKKRGKTPRYAVLSYRNWTDEDSVALKEFIGNTTNISQKTLIDLYVEFCFDFLEVLVDVIGRQRICTLNPTERGLISLDQFRYHFKKDIPYLALLKRRVGQIDFDNNYKGVPGSSRFWVRGPTVRYEIDATVSSIYLRYALSDDLALSAGKPHLYVVVDVFSAMIVGFYVTFLDEQWTAAAQALYNAFSDKVEFCREFGVNITEEEWPCHHPCDEFTFDRGGPYSENNIESYLRSEIGTKLGNVCRAYKGAAKGLVEAAIHWLEDETKKMPGAVRKKRRELAHPSNHPVYTYYDFVQALIDVIVDHNKYSMSMRLLDENMVRHDIKATRLEVWNYGIKHYIDEKLPVPKDALRFGLLPEGSASITAKGIAFKGRVYENAACLDYFSMARSTHREAIKIRYPKVTADYIFWASPDGKKHQLFLNEDSRRFRGVSHHDALLRTRIEAVLERQGWAHKFAAKIRRYARKLARDKAARKAMGDTTSSFRKSPQPGIWERKQEAAYNESLFLRDQMLKDMGIDPDAVPDEMHETFQESSDELMSALFDAMYSDDAHEDDEASDSDEESGPP